MGTLLSGICKLNLQRVSCCEMCIKESRDRVHSTIFSLLRDEAQALAS